MHPALRSYVGVADLLVRTFADCEVVLHDLTVPQRSVVYVANPVVTGRKVGESFEHLIEEAIKAGNPEDGILANYYFEKNGRLIRSSTLLIRDDSERLVGALCINLDTRAATQAMDYLSSLLPGLPPSGKHLSTAASIATKPGFRGRFCGSNCAERCRRRTTLTRSSSANARIHGSSRRVPC